MATAPPVPQSFEDATLRHSKVEEELERICSGAHFRTSKRACEFLRYIVSVSLDGRMDSLKERSIGIDLLGRDISYDPSSDAVVRVRANDVRKRLSSYYASTELTPEIQINLPVGTYIPTFLPSPPLQDKAENSPVKVAVPPPQEMLSSVPPLGRAILMRPVLAAFLLCVLLMRHRLEDRESYLRFWDHILAGRDALILTVASPDRTTLAPSLYPIVWIAGRYGVDTAFSDSSVSEAGFDRIASVQASFTTPAAMVQDKRLRWILAVQQGQSRIIDRMSSDNRAIATRSSAAVLTILPESTATLHLQGTDNEAIQNMLEELTSQKHFPEEMIGMLGNRHVLQVLLFRESSGSWKTQFFTEER